MPSEVSQVSVGLRPKWCTEWVLKYTPNREITCLTKHGNLAFCLPVAKRGSHAVLPLSCRQTLDSAELDLQTRREDPTH